MIKQLEFQINNQLCSESEKKWANPTAWVVAVSFPWRKQTAKPLRWMENMKTNGRINILHADEQCEQRKSMRLMIIVMKIIDVGPIPV